MPRYLQLATLFRQRIQSGEWRVDAQIPTVDDLAAQCGVARATIRQALGLLEIDGLISRFRAKGTFVNKRPQDRLWLKVETDLKGLMSAREGARIEILRDEAGLVPTLIPHAIGESAPSYRHLRRRHWVENIAFLVADVYIDERIVPRIPEGGLTTLTALRLVSSLRGVKVSDARQTMTIGAADLETAELMQLPLNAPIAYVHRTAVDQRGRIIMISNGTYRGDIVRVDMELK